MFTYMSSLEVRKSENTLCFLFNVVCCVLYYLFHIIFLFFIQSLKQRMEKAMATYSSTLAGKIPWMGEPGGLPSMGLHRVGHDRSDLAAAKQRKKKLHFCRTQQKQVFNYRKVLWLIKLNNKKTMKIPLHTFSEQPQSRTLTASNAGKVVHQLFIGRGSTKWYRHFGWQFGSFLQNKMTLGHTPSHRTSWYLPKCVESFCPHKNFLTDVYSSFIHNYQNLRSKIVPSGLPWWCIGKKSACQCRRHGFNPWFRRIPCATKQLSLCAITTLEPVSHNCWDHVPWQLKPKHPRALTPKRKKPP